MGLLYGCGLRCMEARSVRLQDLDFDRLQLKMVQGKNKKDRYVLLGKNLVRGLKSNHVFFMETSESLNVIDFAVYLNLHEKPELLCERLRLRSIIICLDELKTGSIILIRR
jgi:site-specific recombinase XerD